MWKCIFFSFKAGIIITISLYTFYNTHHWFSGFLGYFDEYPGALIFENFFSKNIGHFFPDINLFIFCIFNTLVSDVLVTQGIDLLITEYSGFSTGRVKWKLRWEMMGFLKDWGCKFMSNMDPWQQSHKDNLGMAFYKRPSWAHRG